MTPFLNGKPLRSIYNTRLKEPATPDPLQLDLQCTIIQPNRWLDKCKGFCRMNSLMPVRPPLRLAALLHHPFLTRLPFMMSLPPSRRSSPKKSAVPATSTPTLPEETDSTDLFGGST
ncbi:hypothetical protein AMECASPLE_034126 [Ameca splendens]|uniref:Uncharacterized protein n=1 Tax=Ameca splendens TaxID=208324 RepID=A0ABV1AEM9_9TELE